MPSGSFFGLKHYKMMSEVRLILTFLVGHFTVLNEAFDALDEFSLHFVPKLLLRPAGKS